MNGYSVAGALDSQPDLLARLQNVVRQLNRPDIRTVSALVAKVIGDQNAGMMAVRLLHWFPKAKKIGGWVYKSWRDWNAECNLSQAQVKRVHGKGFLEIIGIERTIMKANGTPTVHYRLDENQLMQRLAEFLEIMPLRIKMWMWTETPNEDGQSSPMNVAGKDQLDEHNQPDSFDEDEPIHSVEIAKSITDSDLQTKQHINDQDIQHNSYSAAVVDTEREERKEILVSLGNFGVEYLKAKQLIEKHGYKRVAEVVEHTKDQDRKNPAGYIIRALGENWTFWSKPIKDDYACGNGEAYITGKYAAFINH
ncbi:MAG: hypothetical protein H0X30_16615 [Anaerolineae bacterium]|nr:hypothetical protein [Anaerolineae bacterium]